MEPWDGPACVTFTDGTADRRGPRPQRPAPRPLLGHRRRPGRAGQRGRRARHRPGEGRPQGPPAARPDVPGRHRGSAGSSRTRRSRPPSPPSTRTQEWLHAGLIQLDDLPEREHIVHTHASVTRRQQTFGYTEEELRVLLAPMARTGAEPIGSMGTDTPVAVLSDSRGCSSTTSPSCSRRSPTRRWTRSARSWSPRLAHHDRPRGQPARAHAGRLPPGRAAVPGDRQRRAGQAHPHQRRRRPARPDARSPSPASTRSPAAARRCAPASRRSASEVAAAIAGGARIIVLSDRHSDAEHAPIPSLLLTAAVHHHLIREKTRTQVGLVVEAGDVREVHHVALLIGYGAAAVNPYLAMESVEDLARAGVFGRHRARAGHPQPDQGARQGRAEGDVQDGHLHRRLLPRRPGLRGDRPVAGPGRRVLHRHHQQARRHRPGRRSPRRSPRRHAARLPQPSGTSRLAHRRLEIGGEYQWRREGEPHLFDPETVFRLQHATREQALRHLQAVHRARRRAVRAADDAARAVQVQGRRARADPDRRGRAGLRDRQALLHRRDVLRLHLRRGARDAGHRDEPARRQVQHRRGRRGRRTGCTTRSAAARSSRSPPAGSA